MADFERKPVPIVVFYAGLVFHGTVETLHSLEKTTKLNDEYGLKAANMVKAAKCAVAMYRRRFDKPEGVGCWLHHPDFMPASLLAPRASGFHQQMAKNLVPVLQDRNKCKTMHNAELLLDKEFGAQVQKLADTGCPLELRFREAILWKYVSKKLTSMFAESTFSMMKSSFIHCIASQIPYSSRQVRKMANPESEVKEAWLAKGGMFFDDYEDAKKCHPHHKKKNS